MTTSPQHAEFNPATGSPILLQPVGYDGKLKTSFVGMEPGHYIIASLAPFLDEIETLSKYLERGRKARIFYSKDGVVMGYRVQMQGYTTSPLKLLYFTYPKEAETYNLRNHDRIVCHLPGLIIGEGINARCLVQNLSSGGCGICLDPADAHQLDALPAGENLELRFQLNTLPDKLSATCQFMGSRQANGLTETGLKFLYVAEDALEAINTFISFVIDHRS